MQQGGHISRAKSDKKEDIIATPQCLRPAKRLLALQEALSTVSMQDGKCE